MDAFERADKDFELLVVKSEYKDSDKELMFTNLSSSNVFHGLVDEFLVYSRALTATEMAKLPLRP